MADLVETSSNLASVKIDSDNNDSYSYNPEKLYRIRQNIIAAMMAESCFDTCRSKGNYIRMVIRAGSPT
ncbi:MAG: hypothetical protein MZV64_18510 [Ignavibacteriales bacterium]|nr:hypothetical protein [Ignavibacteriales bacterium]